MLRSRRGSPLNNVRELTTTVRHPAKGKRQSGHVHTPLGRRRIQSWGEMTKRHPPVIPASSGEIMNFVAKHIPDCGNEIGSPCASGDVNPNAQRNGPRFGTPPGRSRNPPEDEFRCNSLKVVQTPARSRQVAAIHRCLIPTNVVLALPSTLPRH